MPIMILPFLGSGFVPTESMPGVAAVVRRVAAVHAVHRDACGRCCSARRSGSNGWLTLVWCVGITLVGWLWARFLYERKTVR